MFHARESCRAIIVARTEEFRMNPHSFLSRHWRVLLALAALMTLIGLNKARVVKADDAAAPAAPAGTGYPGIQAPSTQNSPDAPAGYAVAASTDVGKAWVTKKAGITTVAAALETTLHDLSAFFRNKPVIKGAFEDTKDHRSGAASFTAILGGQGVVGLATCRLGDNEAKISVTYCLASATPADWAKLNVAA